MHNKEKCLQCKYHGYLTIRSASNEFYEKHGNIFCDYSYYNKGTACKNVKGNLLDISRGNDPDNCLLFEAGSKPKPNVRHLFIKQEEE